MSRDHSEYSVSSADDRMHFVRAPNGLRARLGESEIAHLALLDQPFHRAHRLLDRNLGIHAVQAVDVDDLHTEALERRIAGLDHISRVSGRQHPLEA